MINIYLKYITFQVKQLFNDIYKDSWEACVTLFAIILSRLSLDFQLL